LGTDLFLFQSDSLWNGTGFISKCIQETGFILNVSLHKNVKPFYFKVISGTRLAFISKCIHIEIGTYFCLGYAFIVKLNFVAFIRIGLLFISKNKPL